MQARDSVTGEMYRWVAGTPDFAGSGYTGPNSADEVAVVASPGDVTGSPAPGLASVLANGSDANGSTITNLGAPSGATSPVRVQDETNHIVVNSTDTAVVDAALLGVRNPANTHVLVRFTGGGVKTLEIASDLTASSVNGMLITVSANSSASFSINVDVKDGTFEGRSGPVEVSASTTSAVGFTIGKFGNSNNPNWAFVGMPRVSPVPLSSASAALSPAVAQNTAIGYSEEIGARRNTGSSAVGVQVFQRVSRSAFDTASQTLISGGIGASAVPENCMIVAEADVVAVGSVRYAAKLVGTFQVSAGTITKLFDAVIGPPLPAELSDLLFNVTDSAIGVRLIQASAGPSWTFTTRTTFTVVEDPS